ncbi:MAG: prepilin peptidase [Pirellulales bacterium]|nr:prepilin peptidase [Pirellulales bacterium]
MLPYLHELISLLPALWLAWCAVFGACIGSFLNVVIYRLPRQMSLSWPGSHCPRCRVPIRWYDNIPLLSWALWLRGKCRHCQAGISARYPAVELTVALIWWGLAWALVSAPQARFLADPATVWPAIPPQVSLPGNPAESSPFDPVPTMLVPANPQLLRNLLQWLASSLYLTGTLAAVLIAWDGLSPPRLFGLGTLICGIAALALTNFVTPAYFVASLAGMLLLFIWLQTRNLSPKVPRP